MEQLKSIECILTSSLENYGFEVYPFLLDWYNDLVDPPFVIPCRSGTVAFVIISTPSMFEKTVLPFLRRSIVHGQNDPLDESIKQQLQTVLKDNAHIKAELIHDFELHPNRRPKVLVQTAGHVAGAVHFYQRSNLSPENDPWLQAENQKNIFGCAVHPKYGGWFALRAVCILNDIQCPELPRPQPCDPFKSSPNLIIELLSKFNGHWQDCSFRDVIPVAECYSDRQKKYFATEPADRPALIAEWRLEGFL